MNEGAGWRARVDEIWADSDLDDDAVIAAIDAATSGHDDDPIALYERGGARDSAGREAAAESFYRRALELGLPEDVRERCVIQLASTIRNLGRSAEAAELLRETFPDDSASVLRDAGHAFLALALDDLGRSTEGVRLLLNALAGHLPRYSRAVRAYAEELPRSS